MVAVAAIQMVSSNDRAPNLDRAAQLIAKAANRGAKLIVLPENFAVFGQVSTVKAAQEEGAASGRIRTFLTEQAKSRGVWLVGGTIPTPTMTRKFFASCFVISPQGVEVACYNKIHLFDVQVDDAQSRYHESAIYQPGEKVVLVNTPIGVLGLAVCYDLRFPELFRLMVDHGAEIICLPAAFTQVTGAVHWQPLVRARAIENQVFMIAADQGGVHSEKRNTYGHSMIVDPWGDILAVHEKGEGVVIADIELDSLVQIRAQIPVLENRRIMFGSASIPVEVIQTQN